MLLVKRFQERSRTVFRVYWIQSVRFVTKIITWLMETNVVRKGIIMMSITRLALY